MLHVAAKETCHRDRESKRAEEKRESELDKNMSQSSQIHHLMLEIARLAPPSMKWPHFVSALNRTA